MFEQLLQAKSYAPMSPPSAQLGGKIGEFPKPFRLTAALARTCNLFN
jgi:hypothetical protein